MTRNTTRTHMVRQALAAMPAAPSSTELDLLTRYALGYISLERANELLRAHGRTLRLPAEAGEVLARA